MYRKLFCLVSFVLVLGLAGMAGAEEGLIGEYYHGSASDAWDDLVMERLDPTVDFGWGNGSPEPGVVNVDNFKVRWTGEVEIPSTGTYTFHTQTDDGVRLWVNDVLVLENWTDHGSTLDSGDINLEGGQRYPIKLEWYENGGGAICQLSWEGPKIARQIIPSSYLWVGGDRPNAHNPTPADGTLHEDTWVNLSWVPGDFAVSHDVYFGEIYYDVDNGIGDTFQGNQTLMELTIGFPGFAYPDGLVPGTTYYWRIDEVEADGTTKHKGFVWSFAVPPKTAYLPEPADGAEAVDPEGKLSWTPGFGSILHYVYFGDNFDDVSNAAGNPPWGSTTFDPGPLQLSKTYYWRVDEFDIVETHKGDVWSFTTEGAVGNPNPSNGAVDAKQTPVLSWVPGVFAASHNVYFGTDEEVVRNADTSAQEYKGNQALGSESYDPGQLDWDTTYYWRVDEVNDTNPDGPWTGAVWSLKTANFPVIDDFEYYNDLEPDNPESNNIFYTWLDGFDDPANGSLVGYEFPPFTERTIVHGGKQSMPLYYDNSVTHSEAAMTLDYPTDWTEGGVTTLTIWFYGDPDNAAEQLYVALNGSAVATNDNPNAAQIEEWTEWIIDLQAFADQGVDLTDVNTIAIGLGDKNNPQPGGTGTMYFDDIALH
ncbi:hypothetical protein ES703_24238 [subsurface metagenome]